MDDVNSQASSGTVSLKLAFDPMTIEHLGFKMYSHLPNALAELIANSYDADATSVTVQIEDDGSQAVRVIDDGHGMNAEDLQEKYLRIGRNRRVELESGVSEAGKRRVAGRKGLGKLALFGIGDQIVVETKRTGADVWTVLTLDWNDLRSAAGREYEPVAGFRPGKNSDHGTRITVREMRRKTRVRPPELAASLARLFNYDRDFEIQVVGPSGDKTQVNRDLRYSSLDIESSWEVPKDFDDDRSYAQHNGISGRIIASSKPLKATLRGITLYVHGRLANDPEYFGVPESGYAYSYLTGYVEADFLDELEEDVIATDRRSVSWETEQAERFREYMERVVRRAAELRRDGRKAAQKTRIRKDLNVDTDHWVGTIEGDQAQSLGRVIEVLTSPDSEIGDRDRRELVAGLQEIAPEYADLHWRNLHPSVQRASKSLYENKHYHLAVTEAMKRYVSEVREAGRIDVHLDESDVLQKAFGPAGEIQVFKKWAAQYSIKTQTGVQAAQRNISIGLHSGFRNPLSHHEVNALAESGAFTYQDCLDALSILSHLFRRVDSFKESSEKLVDIRGVEASTGLS